MAASISPICDPVNDIALPPCDEAMLRDLPGAIPRANGCVPCSTVGVPAASRFPSLETTGGCTAAAFDVLPSSIRQIPTATSGSVWVSVA